MKINRWLMLAVVCSLPAGFAGAADQHAAAAGPRPFARLRPVEPDDVHWTQGFWADRWELCRRAVIPAVGRALSDPQNGALLANFRVAAGLEQGRHRATNWSDGDCYKWIESMAHVYLVTKDPELDRLMDQWIGVIARAQDQDGYLSTNIQCNPDKQRWENLRHHELYNFGHLLTAACVHHRATGKESFLTVARKAGDYLCKTFLPRPKKLARFGFNPSNIMGAVDLYRVTGERKYLELAATFVENRGSRPATPKEMQQGGHLGGTDCTQDRVPLRNETQAVGHCVCATYLYCGAADVVAETGDRQLLAALERIWRNATLRRTYITGGIGSGRRGVSPRGDPVHEAYGVDFELPNRTAYCETCSNIGSAMWNWRMLLLTGDPKYADMIETVMYNAGLSPLSADGKRFFYANPLKWDGPRADDSPHHTPLRWAVHKCFCCPPQVARTLAKLLGWVYALSEDAVWVNLYGGSVLDTQLPDGSAVKLSQKTEYPWHGRIRLTIEATPDREMAIVLRIPGWAEKAQVGVNGKPVATPARPGAYVTLRRVWKPGDVIALELPMPVRLMEAHPGVSHLSNYVAVQRGPVVYCAEFPLEQGGGATWEMEKGDRHHLPERPATNLRSVPGFAQMVPATFFGPTILQGCLDQDGGASWENGVFLPENATFEAQYKPDFLGGVVLRCRALTHAGREAFGKKTAEVPLPEDPTGWSDRLYRPLVARELPQPDSGTVELMLIPYFAWANRGESMMEVWLPLAR